jgi:hypothetical protein
MHEALAGLYDRSPPKLQSAVETVRRRSRRVAPSPGFRPTPPGDPGFGVKALLLADGFALPEDALHDPTFADASAETIYHRLALPPEEPDREAPPTPGAGDASAPPQARKGPGDDPAD